ncbi:MAG: nucleoside triphosphate pyrophosphohydrolase [Pseudomonadota bacterium]
MQSLLKLMQTLRDPHVGCPWDQRQTFESIAPYTIEEAYEVADAIKKRDWSGLRSELGDLLFQVVFHAQMAREAGHFSFDEVVTDIVAKMHRRHPHVFGTEEERRAGPPDWEAMKQAERESENEPSQSGLDGIPSNLPALSRAHKTQSRAATVGFDWPDIEGVRAKVIEELDEVLHEVNTNAPISATENELGDLLFSCVNLARHLGINPERALDRAVDKFDMRFRLVEQLAGERAIDMGDATLEELDEIWREAKIRIAMQSGK